MPLVVTDTLVAPGEMSGIFSVWQIGAASSVRPEVISPSTATTLSREMSFLTTVADSPAFDWSSSVSSSSWRPRTPPPALISSIASKVPLCAFWPNTASLPVSEANSPILMVSWAATVAASTTVPRASRDTWNKERVNIGEVGRVVT